MKVNRDEVVELFCQLGLKKAAPKWTDEVLLGKIDGLAEIVRAVGKEGLPKKGSPSFKLLAELVTAKKNGESFTLTGSAKAKPKAKPDPEEDEDDEEEGDDDDTDGDADDEGDEDGEDEEDEGADTDADDEDDAEGGEEDEDDADDESDSDDGSDDDESETDDEGDDVSEAVATKPGKKTKEVPATKPAKPGKPPVKEPKKAPPAKKGGDGKPGVIQSIVEFIQAASQSKPISKKEIHARLVKRFPTNDADGMMKTINAQVPNRLIQQKGLNVVKTDDKKFYIGPEKSGKKAK